MSQVEKYSNALALSSAIEKELKALNRWSDHNLPQEKFENMGAFGSNTMTFEQWIQFVLLPRLNEIIETKSDFPQSSMIATYAVKAFDGDYETIQLQRLLSELDALANGEDWDDLTKGIPEVEQEKITLNSKEIPSVVYTVINLLPQFEDDDLESQLQTIDVFLQTLHASVRSKISSLMRDSLNLKSVDPKVRERILKAAEAVAHGESAAASYNHEEAMKKYREEHLKNFPNLSGNDDPPEDFYK